MPTKILPRRRKPGRRFLIVDIPEARLKDPSVAKFTQGTINFQVDLREMPKGRRAVGRIPETASGGMYDVVVTVPGGPSPIPLGQIEIRAPAATPEDADIEPMAGPVGTRFTVTDPQERMQPTDVCLFYAEGSDPQTGTQVSDADITAGSLTGSVPGALQPGLYLVTVRPSPSDSARFTDLPFSVDL